MYKPLLVAVLAVAMALVAAAQTDPVAVLQSDAPLAEKSEACRLLSTMGDSSAVPALEALLTDEMLSHMARYALEPMPGDEADAALRRALEVTSGKLKAGVVTSLGVRRDTDAVPELIPLLRDEDGSIREAAARTLGRIGAPAGIDMLVNAIDHAELSYAFAQALADGVFIAAERLKKEGNHDDAAWLYHRVHSCAHLPVHIRAAALRGAILARGARGGLTLLLEALQGADPDFFAVALRTAQEMDGRRKTAAGVAKLLPALTPERKIPVIQLLGELGSKKAGAALLKEAEAGPVPVRAAALRAAARLGYVPALPVMASLITAEDAELAEAARNGLAYFPGEKGDSALRNLLEDEDAQVRCAAVELVGAGGLPAPVDLLMQLAADDADAPVRLAALKGAKEYAGASQVQGFLNPLLQPRSEDERVAAEEGLKRICERAKSDEEQAARVEDVLCEALAASEGETRLALMRVLTVDGSQKAFDSVLPLALSDEPALKEAAVSAVANWPSTVALPTLMEWVKAPAGDARQLPALRGAVRLLMLGEDTPESRCARYASLMALASSPGEKKLVLSGLGKVGHACALTMVLDQITDEAVKEEAVQAAIAIAEQLGDTPENAAAMERARALIPELQEKAQQ
ncbi:MAG: HEAT repeat protein [Candidatus Hydrogenedentes bacterium ADurb.Bin101]|nr:MAG: HEAT repeat protein [Candidatus Hydrogenedentes bacterium ADurb.Bin101]